MTSSAILTAESAADALPAALRATVRPAHLDAPAYLSQSPPLPTAAPISADQAAAHASGPTRYGDWELKGIAIDF